MSNHIAKSVINIAFISVFILINQPSSFADKCENVCDGATSSVKYATCELESAHTHSVVAGENSILDSYKSVYGTTSEDEIIDRIRRGEIAIPLVVRDIRAGKLSKVAGQKLLQRISVDVKGGQAIIERSYEGFAIVHHMAGGNPEEQPRVEDLKNGMAYIKRAIHRPKSGTYATIERAIKLAREHGDTAKVNEITAQWQRFRRWENSLNMNEDNPSDFLTAYNESIRYADYFISVVSEYTGADYQEERDSHRRLEIVANGARTVAKVANGAGAVVATMMTGNPAVGARYYMLMDMGQEAVYYANGMRPAPTRGEVAVKALEYAMVWAGNHGVMAPKGVPPSTPKPATPALPTTTLVDDVVTPVVPKSTSFIDDAWEHISGSSFYRPKPINGSKPIVQIRGGVHTETSVNNFIRESGQQPIKDVVLGNGVRRIEFGREAFTQKAWNHTVDAARRGSGVPGGKTIFPASWGKEEIAEATRNVVKPENILVTDYKWQTLYEGIYNGVRIRVSFANGKVQSAYPTWIQP